MPLQMRHEWWISRCVYVSIPSFLLDAGSFLLLSTLFSGGVSDRGEGDIPAAFVAPTLLQGTERQQTVSDCGMSTARWDGFLHHVRRNRKTELAGRAEPGSPGLRLSAGLILSI